MNTIEIKHKITGETLYTAISKDGETLTVRSAIEMAVSDGANLIGADLSGSNLSGSNLSGSDLSGSDLSWSDLIGSNLSGSDLSGSNLSGSNLSRSNLRRSNLSGSNLSGSNLIGSNLSGSDLSGSDLSGSNLIGSNLSGSDLSGSDLSGSNLIGSNLSGSDLSGADLSGAKMEGVPIIQNIHAVVYAAASVPGALNMNNWHCGTTHCRAGWVVTLAGEAGRILEGKIGTPAAAMAIYMTSDPARWENEPLPDFYCGNNEALADMKRMAEEGRAS